MTVETEGESIRTSPCLQNVHWNGTTVKTFRLCLALCTVLCSIHHTPWLSTFVLYVHTFNVYIHIVCIPSKLCSMYYCSAFLFGTHILKQLSYGGLKAVVSLLNKIPIQDTRTIGSCHWGRSVVCRVRKSPTAKWWVTGISTIGDIYIYYIYGHILFIYTFRRDILLIDGIHPANQLISSLSPYLHGFIHPGWCRVSSINSIFVATVHLQTS